VSSVLSQVRDVFESTFDKIGMNLRGEFGRFGNSNGINLLHAVDGEDLTRGVLQAMETGRKMPWKIF
jgi:hypothetical protein